MPWLCPFWVKFLILNVVLRVSRRKKVIFFSLRSFSFMCCRWNVYRRALIPRKLLYLEKFLVTCLEMETKLSISVMQNLLATWWLFIINMCGTGVKTFFILLFICYIIDVFSFSFIFSPLKGRYWFRKNMVSWFIKLMNLQTVFNLSFSEFSWKVDVNCFFAIIKSYVKVNFK